jgi:hypothetical protein
MMTVNAAGDGTHACKSVQVLTALDACFVAVTIFHTKHRPPQGTLYNTGTGVVQY